MAHGLLYGASFTNGVLSFTDKKGRTICNADLRNYLTLTATSDNSSVKLKMNGTLSNEFEVNVGNGWQSYTFGHTINLNAGQSCKWRCSAHPTTQTSSNYVYFVMTGSIEASGNCNSMLSSDFDNITSLTGYDYAFASLFQGCASLKRAPELPATTLARSCYSYMFNDCNNITQAPELPATTLAKFCYQYMFDGCYNLTQAPALPAMTLADSCYRYMFSNCNNLTQAPELPATNLANYCYQYMFYWCYNLTQAPALPAMTLANYCYLGMFYNCTSLTQSPELPATTLANYCYKSMFYGCNHLTQATELPSTTLADYCYSDMFHDCTSIMQAPALPATTLANYCYQAMFSGCSKLKEARISATTTAIGALDSWLNGVAATGDFYCDPNATIFQTGESGIPKGWTRLPLSYYPTT